MSEMRPEGYYYGIVRDHGFGPKDGDPGTPYIAVQFDLETMDTKTPKGSITAYLYLSDKAIEATAKKLRSIGYAGSDASELSDGTLLRGKRCQVQVVHEAYEGKLREKVGWINEENYTPGVAKGEASAKANAGRLSTLLKTIPVKEDPIPF